jgi:hypothetical protein
LGQVGEIEPALLRATKFIFWKAGGFTLEKQVNEGEIKAISEAFVKIKELQIPKTIILVRL